MIDNLSMNKDSNNMKKNTEEYKLKNMSNAFSQHQTIQQTRASKRKKSIL